ncbi:hypothetical protein FOC1_g10001630 [Fusarium oxysporum f. sp. cubense race 1]|uniref:Zn(2)-C6 fungal-type domain-containing protein n=1 Tax=Fusarium oxysporum f. sp. cubense (strain race 1) TaxID=1229664 RepID=N4TRX6_FUSC1|nr:hypothetical protein FOC1_g10001630 [Fusarium oxysporum f. sp. cubense race 1]
MSGRAVLNPQHAQQSFDSGPQLYRDVPELHPVPSPSHSALMDFTHFDDFAFAYYGLPGQSSLISLEDKADATPPWSGLKTKAGKERKRLPLACIACRRKKIRCSGEKPACKDCLRSCIPCVYKVTTRKAAPRTDCMAMLDKRPKRME